MEPRTVSAVCFGFLISLSTAAAQTPPGEPRLDPVEMGTLTTLGHVVLSADARIDREGQRHSWVRIRSKGITLGRFAITDTRLALDGLTGDHALQFRVGTGQDAVSLRGRGAWADGKYVLHLQGIEAKGPRLVPWHLEAPGTLEASRRDASLDPVCIVFEERRMCLQGRWEAGGEWFAKVETGSFPLEALDPKRLGAPRYRGILMVDAEARGTAGGPWVADLRAEIRDALLAIGAEVNQTPMTPRRVRAAIELALSTKTEPVTA